MSNKPFEEKTGVGKFLASIGNFFTGIVNGAGKTFRQLPGEHQELLKTGPGIIAVVNKFVDAPEEEVKAEIAKLFPKLQQDEIDSALNKAALKYGLDIEKGAITALQEALKNTKGKDWADLSDGFAKAISLFFAPADQKATVVISLIWWVYHKFFKNIFG